MSSLKGKTLEEIHGKERALEIRKKISEFHKGMITPIGRPKDTIITDSLTKQGYIVFRFWEREINNNIEQCISMIKNYIMENK